MVGVIFSNIHDENIPELSRHRTMASIPFGGRYRLIDFALSNMVNAGITTVKKEVFYECENLSVVRAPRSVANYIELPYGAYFEYTD